MEREGAFQVEGTTPGKDLRLWRAQPVERPLSGNQKGRLDKYWKDLKRQADILLPRLRKLLEARDHVPLNFVSNLEWVC